MALEIRAAAAADVAALVDLHREVHALHLAECPDQFKPTRDEEIADRYEELVVTAAQRRSGIGRALLQTVADAATAAGVSEVELNSWAFNHVAHAAFQSFGFVPKVIRFELKR